MPTARQKPPVTQTKRTAPEVRLSIRTNASQKELLKRAALARNTDLSQFVLEASLGEARRLVSEESTVLLSPADYEQLCRAMDEVPAPNPALRTLFSQKRVWDE
jgi:uncharacterized protein (DUF1778 family)